MYIILKGDPYINSKTSVALFSVGIGLVSASILIKYIDISQYMLAIMSVLIVFGMTVSWIMALFF